MFQVEQFRDQVARHLPDLDPEVMESWSNDPQTLQQVLKDALLPPPPIIAVTGTEELDISEGFSLQSDVVEPAGVSLLLEFINPFDGYEDSILVEEMRRRAEEMEANLGLRHAQAFLTKYKRNGFSLPYYVSIPFFGTPLLSEAHNSFIPSLTWNGGIWYLSWLCLPDIFHSHRPIRFLRRKPYSS